MSPEPTGHRDKRRSIIVFVHPYRPTAGGAIALLALAQRLQQLGEPVLIWPIGKSSSYVPTSWSEGRAAARAAARRVLRRPFDLGPFGGIPVARIRDVRDAIVVYPEIVDDNPVRAPHVVRWFLHRPGYHTGKVSYGDGETYFFYQDAFNDPSINPDDEHRLSVAQWNPAYVDRNQGQRHGTCYLVRKGTESAAGRIRDDEVRVDDMTHEEAADAFNQHDYLRCFDLYTMYATYAAVCGCVPVIEPVDGLTKEQWYPDERDRYGLAYGWDDVAWARETRGLLISRLAAQQEEELQMVRRFVRVLRERYP